MDLQTFLSEITKEMQEEIDSFEKMGKNKNKKNYHRKESNQQKFRQRNQQGGQPRFQLR